VFLCEKKFKKKFRAARQRSWEKFAENDLKQNSWDVVYRLAADTFQTADILSCSAKDDGTIILTPPPEQTMTYLITHLLDYLTTILRAIATYKTLRPYIRRINNEKPK
jgi:hypothetical protein